MRTLSTSSTLMLDHFASFLLPDLVGTEVRVPPSVHRPIRVAIVQRAIRQYRSGFYDSLRAQLASDGIELLLFHSNQPPEDDSRDDAIDIPWARHLPRRTIRLGRQRLIWQPFDPALREAQLVIVEQASDLALNYRLLWWQRRGHGRVAFWGHGRNLATRRSSLGEKAKAWVSRHVHWWFAYTSLSADIVASLGFDLERITVVNNAIDTAQLANDLQAVGSDAVDRLRDRLDLGDGPVGLFLGTLRPNKRIDVLLEAAARIHDAHPDFRLLIIGSGPCEDEVRTRAGREPWLRYLGARYGQDRAEVLAASDLLLLPGWVGLVVLDSFVAGTPLVTSRHSPHGPEIAYLRDGENGRLVDDDGEPGRYAAAVVELIEDPDLHARLVAGCESDAGRYSVEAMAASFADGIHRALATPSRR